MSPRALTPLFQWSGPAGTQTPLPGGICFPSPTAGNHAGETVFLAVATALLTATAAAPLTAGLGSPWLRWPLGVVLLFLLPHAVIALISPVSGKIAGTRWHRGVVQDWGCLVAMTAYAAWRSSTAIGWTAWICHAWLAFMALNALIWLVRCARGGRSSC